MSEPDQAFLRNLRDIAADVPNPESVRSTVQVGYNHRIRRRRILTIGSAAAVVLVVAGATTVLSAGQAISHQLTPPVTSGATSMPTVSTTHTPTSLAPIPSRASTSTSTTAGTRRQTAAATSAPESSGSPLVAAPVPDLLSPVSLPPSWTSFDPDGPSIRAGRGYLAATWDGIVSTAFGNPAAPSSTKDLSHAFGYLVTRGKPSLTVEIIGAAQGPRAPLTASTPRPITVDGHAAQYLTAPPNSYDATYHTPAVARIAWQLPDHRWIQVWEKDSELNGLTDLAAAVTNQPTRFQQSLSLGLTLEGVTNPTVIFTPGQPPSVKVCAVPDIAGGLNRSNDPCVSAFANRQTVDQAIADLGTATSHTAQQIEAATTVISHGGGSITVNTLLQIGMYRSGQLTIGAWVPPTTGLSGQQLATLAASVQVPTNLSITDTTTSPATTPTG